MNLDHSKKRRCVVDGNSADTPGNESESDAGDEMSEGGDDEQWPSAEDITVLTDSGFRPPKLGKPAGSMTYRLMVTSMPCVSFKRSGAISTEKAYQAAKLKLWNEAVCAWRRSSTSAASGRALNSIRVVMNLGDNVAATLRDKRAQPDALYCDQPLRRHIAERSTHLRFCNVCYADARARPLQNCTQCPRAVCIDCATDDGDYLQDGAVISHFACPDCKRKACASIEISEHFAGLRVDVAQDSNLVSLLDESIDKLSEDLAHVETLSAHGALDVGPQTRGISKKGLAGIELFKKLGEAGSLDDGDDDEDHSPLSAQQLGALKKALVTKVFELGHGDVDQTRTLLEAIFNDPVIQMVAPRFGLLDEDQCASKVLESIKQFTVARRLGPKGGTYTTSAYRDLETLAMATKDSGLSMNALAELSGLPMAIVIGARNIHNQHRERRVPRATSINMQIAVDDWHYRTRLDSFSKGLKSTPACERRRIQEKSNRVCYEAFEASDALKAERLRLKNLGLKGWEKAFSYWTYLRCKCRCIQDPQLRSCVCELCAQLEFYLVAITTHRAKRAQKTRRDFDKLTLREKARIVAPQRAVAVSTCALKAASSAAAKARQHATAAATAAASAVSASAPTGAPTPPDVQ